MLLLLLLLLLSSSSSLSQSCRDTVFLQRWQFIGPLLGQRRSQLMPDHQPTSHLRLLRWPMRVLRRLKQRL